MTSPAVPVASPPINAGALDGPSIDGSAYRQVTDFARRTPWLHGFMSAYTTAGIIALCVLLAAGWWLARRSGDLAQMTAVAWTCCGTVIAVAAGLCLKQVFTETRPCLAIHATTVQTCPGPTDYSFPSDHATVAFALAAGIWLVNHRLGLVAALAALLEGVSRVYLGQHYPHDVVAALALSALILFPGWILARRPLNGVLRRVARTPLAPLLATRH
ncbi:phosphatase PAP2 family protein [Actinomadura opuntiae]|uniref:phosphatase PAP2 family protein n=1 Tax=Actinomadura sp. OS1-43 TaxID=604315 RepID=UPI00255AB3B8|nr:phosphatase PAP2 family protein [Actinomadura sp. OS1-43]MDL4818672.1 phosphatase PAP2 family protein [Actinomadura sp. OS1-43]